ncbi:hypothetical protein [Haladaptatus sp. NG-WS-4]
MSATGLLSQSGQLAKLVDQGVIEFDELNETIHPGEHTEQVVNALASVGASLDANQEVHARSEHDDEGN